MKPYTPEHHCDDYWKVVIAVVHCPLCDGLMASGIDKGRRPFPFAYEMTLESQLKRVGAVAVSRVTDIDGGYICVKCAAADKASFRCALCQEPRATSQLQESFGDPPEHLCAECYSTRPTKEWDEKVDGLERAHRYDYE